MIAFPFDGSLIVTVAPGTTAPEVSFTVPTIAPVISCPRASPLRQIVNARANRIELHVFFLIVFLPCSKLETGTMQAIRIVYVFGS
jgi:hypothetical protein